MSKSKKVITATTYKIWLQVERHEVYADGSDKYTDVQDACAPAGEFKNEQDAIDQMNAISEEYSNVSL